MPLAREPDWATMMRLVVITPGAACARSPVEVVSAALAGGCRAVQLRDKEMEDRVFSELALVVRRECVRAGALFFVNDRVDVAASVGADGVHLGVTDLPVEDARRILGPGAVIGYSPETPDEARAAAAAGADYLGVGPVFRTPTKGDAGEPIGPGGVSLYAGLEVVPVVAVGGIDEENAASVLSAGAVGVAVVSAVSSARDMEEAVRRLLGRLERST